MALWHLVTRFEAVISSVTEGDLVIDASVALRAAVLVQVGFAVQYKLAAMPQKPAAAAVAFVFGLIELVLG